MSDKNIWNKLKSGDKTAFEYIYNTYFEILFQYGRKFTNDESTVEDCIQNLFIELWNKRESISQTNAIKPYLFTALKRKIIRAITKIRKSTDNEIKDHYFDVEISIDEIIISNEIDQINKDRLTEAFEQLSDRQKEILYLRYHANLEYDEIVEIMDMNYQSARNLVSRAISKLSKIWMLAFIIWTLNLYHHKLFSFSMIQSEYKLLFKVFPL